MLIEQTVLNNRNNSIVIQIQAGKTIINPTQLTKVQLLVGTTLFDNITNPQYFNLTLPDRFIFNLGTAGLATGRYLSKIYGFDTVNVLGIEFGEFYINISA